MVASVTASVGCLGWGDIFVSTKPLAGKYRLEQGEADRYYIIEMSLAGSPADGVVDGPVSRIGWNGDHILAWRVSKSARHRPGWMIIDVGKDTVVGPFSEEELAATVARDPRIAHIKTMPTEEAWNKLP